MNIPFVAKLGKVVQFNYVKSNEELTEHEVEKTIDENPILCKDCKDKMRTLYSINKGDKNEN